MNTRRALQAIGVLTAASVVFLYSQAPGRSAGEAQYLGSKMCSACHKGTHPQVVAGWADSAHAHAMLKVENATIVADFSSAPFTKDKVAYVLGTGKRYQSFLDKDFKVLPGEWVAKTKTWQARESVDAAKDCLGCHTTGYDPAAVTWAELGVGCEMCHGPGSLHTSSKDKKGSIGCPDQLDPQRRAMLCGRCHSQGKSKDGNYTFALGFTPGGDLDQYFDVAKEPVAKGLMTNNQYNDLRFEGGKHLANNVDCSACHDPHAKTEKQLRQPLNALCLEKCHPATKLSQPRHSKEMLQSATCNICHLPEGRHKFVPPSS